jgi:hypothetical protein
VARLLPSSAFGGAMQLAAEDTRKLLDDLTGILLALGLLRGRTPLSTGQVGLVDRALGSARDLERLAVERIARGRRCPRRRGAASAGWWRRRRRGRRGRCAMRYVPTPPGPEPGPQDPLPEPAPGPPGPEPPEPDPDQVPIL